MIPCTTPGMSQYKCDFYFGVGVVMLMVGSAGLVGNTLSIIVMSKYDIKSFINCLLIGLFTFDNLILVSAIFYFGINNVCSHKPDQICLVTEKLMRPYVVVYVRPLQLIAQMSSVWLTVAATVARYVAVCKPLEAQSLCTYSRARMYVLLIAIVSTVYNLPHFFDLEVYHDSDTNWNTTIPYFRVTDLFQNKYYHQIYNLWMFLVFVYFVPVVILVVLNVLIWRTLRQASREKHGKLSGLEKKERRITAMLFGVVILDLICVVPQASKSSLWNYDINTFQVDEISDLLLMINSSVNFLIYCFSGKTFRRNLWRMLCSCGRWDKVKGTQFAIRQFPSNTTSSFTSTTQI